MKNKYAFHPFLFAAYAVLGVFQINANEIPLAQIVRPLFVMLAMTALSYFVLDRLYKNPHRAALLTTLWIFWAIYFGHVYRFASNFQFLRGIPGYQLVTLVLWTALIGVFALPKIWNFINLSTLLTTALNVTSVLVLIIPFFVVLTVARETIHRKNIMEKRRAESNITLTSPSEKDPDIYYIIVDGYGRQDTLGSYLHYDNQPFITYLRHKGFYVADKSQANYMMTDLSISSSLNFEYINELENDLAKSSNRSIYTLLIDKNHTRRLLVEQGYQFVLLKAAPSLCAYAMRIPISPHRPAWSANLNRFY